VYLKRKNKEREVNTATVVEMGALAYLLSKKSDRKE